MTNANGLGWTSGKLALEIRFRLLLISCILAAADNRAAPIELMVVVGSSRRDVNGPRFIALDGICANTDAVVIRCCGDGNVGVSLAR